MIDGYNKICKNAYNINIINHMVDLISVSQTQYPNDREFLCVCVCVFL